MSIIKNGLDVLGGLSNHVLFYNSIFRGFLSGFMARE